MPFNKIEIYTYPPGVKIHIQPCCGGRNAKKEAIDSIDVLGKLMSGQGCKKCCRGYSPKIRLKTYDVKPRSRTYPEGPPRRTKKKVREYLCHTKDDPDSISDLIEDWTGIRCPIKDKEDH